MLPSEQNPSQTATGRDHDAVLVSLELSTSKWLVTSRSPECEKMSRRMLTGGDIIGLLGLLAQLRAVAQQRLGRPVRVITIQEAGLDGFWIHRVLVGEGIESHVVDAASVAAPRRGRRAKTDKIDGETLLRTLAAFLRGEPRVCSMVRPPSPEEEDRRRLGRERKVLLTQRVAITNRIRGVLRTQGITGFNPISHRGRKAVEALTTADGRALPEHLKREVARAITRLELVLEQLQQIEQQRDELLAQSPVIQKLMALKGIGPQFAATLALEGFYRSFANRRQLAAYAGLAATPWRSGSIAAEQGISRAGNKRLRETMVELAWLWLRHQRQSRLSRWMLQRVGTQTGRVKRIAIVALARKLLIALWNYVNDGVIPEGAVFKTA